MSVAKIIELVGESSSFEDAVKMQWRKPPGLLKTLQEWKSITTAS